jgi:hypothetical protein
LKLWIGQHSQKLSYYFARYKWDAPTFNPNLAEPCKTAILKEEGRNNCVGV